MDTPCKVVISAVMLIITQVMMFWQPLCYDMAAFYLIGLKNDLKMLTNFMVAYQLIGLQIFLKMLVRFAACWSIDRHVASRPALYRKSEAMAFISSFIYASEYFVEHLLKDIFYAIIVAGCVTIPVSVYGYSLGTLSSVTLTYINGLALASVTIYAHVFPSIISSDFDAIAASRRHEKMMHTIICVVMTLTITNIFL